MKRLILEKMKTQLVEGKAFYSLDEVSLNDYLGKTLTLKHTGHIECTHCGRKLKKTYQQGYCFPCTQKLAECDLCVVKPELCHFDDGTCRDEDWGKKHCMRPHYVYLAKSSHLKIGITREVNIPHRWVDQGAHEAVILFKVQSRFQSGVVEVLLKDLISDKTNWRHMLTNKTTDEDILLKRDELFSAMDLALDEFVMKFSEEDLEICEESDVVSIDYPVLQYPEKVKSLDLIKEGEITGTLQGIKGQYLILDKGVLNMRKFTGLEVELK